MDKNKKTKITSIFLFLTTIFVFGCNKEIPQIFTTNQGGEFMACNIDGEERNFSNIQFSIKSHQSQKPFLEYMLAGEYSEKENARTIAIFWAGNQGDKKFNAKGKGFTEIDKGSVLTDADGRIMEGTETQSVFKELIGIYSTTYYDKKTKIEENYSSELQKNINFKLDIFNSNNSIFEGKASGLLEIENKNEGGKLLGKEDFVREGILGKTKQIDCYFRAKNSNSQEK